jgi:hypothetical protein
VFCRAATVEPEAGAVGDGAAAGVAAGVPDVGEVPVPDIEEEAQIFAAALLMPARLIRKHYRRGMDFHEFCRKFGASGAAMGRRLHRVV